MRFFNKSKKEKEITLDDVIPMHPDEYPGQRLREKLGSRRALLRGIREQYSSEGLEQVDMTESWR